MRLYIAKIQDYDGANGKPGHCRMWLFMGKDDAAVCVLTALPEDAGEGLPAALEKVANRIIREQGIRPARTLWALRNVTGPHRERFAQVDFMHDELSNRVHSPSYAVTDRAALEILTGCALPVILPDEFPPILRRG